MERSGRIYGGGIATPALVGREGNFALFLPFPSFAPARVFSKFPTFIRAANKIIKRTRIMRWPWCFNWKPSIFIPHFYHTTLDLKFPSCALGVLEAGLPYIITIS